jgi:hypothetical protein
LPFLAGSAALAQAQIIDAPVPANACITRNGFDRAWASPVPGADLTLQAGQGWRIPTALELQIAPLATDFLFAGAIVPFNGTDPVSGATFQVTNAAYTSAASAGGLRFAVFRHLQAMRPGQRTASTDATSDGHARLRWTAGRRGALAPVVVQQIPTLGPDGLTLLSLGLALAGLFVARRRRSGQGNPAQSSGARRPGLPIRSRPRT